jgi:curved DNA-binding protein CbpA
VHQDLYRDLGVAATASADDLRRAYQLALSRARSERNRQIIGNAYAILGDPRLRTAYDRGEVVGTGHGRYAQRGIRNRQPRAGHVVLSGQPATAHVVAPTRPAVSRRGRWWQWSPAEAAAWQADAARTRPWAWLLLGCIGGLVVATWLFSLVVAHGGQ